MDGVVHPNVEQAIGRDRIRKALKRYENRPADEHRYGIVRSVNEDGSYEVLLDGDVQTSRCAQYGTALVGDRVLAVTKKDGRNDLIGRLGGEIGGGGTVVTKVDDVSNYVAGRVFAHAGTNDPAGALLCDGRAVSRREYWELFDAIGTTYGAGDGSSTFNLPNIESRTIIGEGTGESGTEYSLGATGGEEKHTPIVEEMAAHSHPEQRTLSLGSGQLDGYMVSGGYTANGSSVGVGTQGGGQPFNVMQPYIVMRYFITTGKGDPVSGINPADYVMEWGNTDGWRWEKWASGKAECWKSVEHTITSWSPWGSSYEGLPSLDQQAFPFEFAEPPVVTPSANSSYGILSVETSRKTTTTLTPVFTVTRPNVGGTDPVTIDIRVKGFWKDSPASGGTATIAPTIAERFEGIESDVDSLAYDSGWLNLYVTTNLDVKARKVGKIVYLYGHSSSGCPVDPGAYVAVTTLPVGWRPTFDIPIALDSHGGDNAAITGYIGTNGILYLYSGSDRMTHWRCFTSFPVD